MGLFDRKKSKKILNSELTNVHNESTLLAEARSVVSSAKSKAKSLEARGRSLI